MSGVAYLPPRPEKQHIRRVLARLRSVLLRKPLPGGSLTTDSQPPAGAPGGVYPITAAVATAGGLTAPDTLRIRSRRRGDQQIVVLSGELNVRNREPLTEALEQALEDDSNGIVLDLSDLVAIDHSGLDTILTAHLRASDMLKELLIVPGPAAVQRTLESARGLFSYAPGQDNRAGGGARSRGRRTGLSPRQGRRATLPHGTRRSR